MGLTYCRNDAIMLTVKNTAQRDLSILKIHCMSTIPLI